MLDYRVWYGTSSANTVLITNYVGLTYTATSLMPGITYFFKVQARNDEGYGTFSNEISALAA